MRPRFSTLVHYFVLAAHAAFLAAIALFLVASVIPQVSGVELRNVVSGSMEPSVDQGALVVSLPEKFDKLQAGDIVVFRAPDGSRQVVAHRVAALHEDGGVRTLETRGDANDASDPWRLQSSDVMGKVRLDVPRAGYAVEKIRSREGFLLLVAIPGVALLLGEMPSWYRALRRQWTREADPSREAVREMVAEPSSPFLRSAGALSICVMAVACAMYVMSPQSGGDEAAVARVSAETASIAEHSATLADGEAFDGDIQVLRDAEDPRLRDPATSGPERVTALRQMLLLNTNRFEALTIVDLVGRVIASTDEHVTGAGSNAAYRESREQHSVAAAFGNPEIHYAAPILDAEGTMHAVLLARTTPERLWLRTLATSIDGGWTLLVSPDGETRPAPDGEKVAIGEVGSEVTQIEVAGATMYCATRPIGRDTHLDAGLRVASCLPAGLVARDAASGVFLAQSAVAVVVAISLGVLILAYMFRESSRSRRTEAASVSALEARLLEQRKHYT